VKKEPTINIEINAALVLSNELISSYDLPPSRKWVAQIAVRLMKRQCNNHSFIAVPDYSSIQVSPEVFAKTRAQPGQSQRNKIVSRISGRSCWPSEAFGHGSSESQDVRPAVSGIRIPLEHHAHPRDIHSSQSCIPFSHIYISNSMKSRVLVLW